jgi:putative ribosome biogenesis GTPase RsgA
VYCLVLQQRLNTSWLQAVGELVAQQEQVLLVVAAVEAAIEPMLLERYLVAVLLQKHLSP